MSSDDQNRQNYFREQYQSILPSLEFAVKVNPNDAYSRESLIKAYYTVGRISDAQEQLRALELIDREWACRLRDELRL